MSSSSRELLLVGAGATLGSAAVAGLIYWLSAKEKKTTYKNPDLNSIYESKSLPFLKDEAESWAMCHGLVMKDAKAPSPAAFGHAAFSLFPSPVRREAFQYAYDVAPTFNLLLDRVSRDYQFLHDTLRGVAKVDDFYAHLMIVLDTVHKEGIKQPLSLGLNRSDYMMQNDAKDHTQPYQVEMNPISVSFPALSTCTSALHRFMVEKFGSKYFPVELEQLPENTPVCDFADALAQAKDMHPYKGQNGCVMMVVQPNETNTADQRQLEYALWERCRVPMIRRTFLEVLARGKLDEKTGDLVIDDHVACVTYLRAGYTPRDYPSQKEWDALLMIERSRSIKCPTLGYHLAGSKKIQQELARPGVLERFIDAKSAQQLRRCFMPQWALDGDESQQKIIQAVIEHPNDYVMKPQRQGGGNNVWGDDIVKVLRTSSAEELGTYIIMKRIKPTPSKAALVRRSEMKVVDAISELGVYGTFIGDGKKVYRNQASGHLLRTKPLEVNEGGVATGYAFLDSPVLV